VVHDDERPSIDGYVLESLIGEGGFGQVWRAFRLVDRTRVAIKVLHFELVSSNDAMTRFKRELAAIEHLDHPNVVRAFAHGSLADGRPYVILEYLDGPSLRDMIRERGTFAPAELLPIMRPLCEALAYAHAAGLIHRDIKASNVVVVQHGEAPRPVLLDFGLVKLLDDAGPGLTSSRTMLGTPTAMAPEQMRGESVDARTDVYALGLLAYHMLTGVPAFGAQGGAIKSYMQLHGPRPRPSSKVDIDPAIDAPIIRALAAAPEDRYASTSEFFDALKHAIEGTSRSSSRRITPVSIVAPAVTDAVAPGVEEEVVVLCVEGTRDDLAQVRALLPAARMRIAVAAPDSLVALAPIHEANVQLLRRELPSLSGTARIALGRSTASIDGDTFDGPALDTESWAPYPLNAGLWIDQTLAY
jgi:serine/threonine protein kinase